MSQHLDRLIGAVAVAAVIALGLGYRYRGTLPPPEHLLSETRRTPVQAPTSRAPFQVTYEGTTYDVEPVASYELWGLVVSHNDITAIGDIDHDATSFDTKDLCMVWGTSAMTGHYLFAEFWSGSWTCNWRYPNDHPLDAHTISNSHLVTDDPAIRKQIAAVRIGDQVAIRGLLVNYRHPDWQRPRMTSVSRDDVGGTACEVVFVESLEIIGPARRLWYRLVPIGWTALGLAMVAAVARFLKRSSTIGSPDPLARDLE